MCGLMGVPSVEPSADGRRSAVADASTQLDPRVKPTAAANAWATAVGTAVCQMFGKPVPATAPKAA